MDNEAGGQVETQTDSGDGHQEEVVTDTTSDETSTESIESSETQDTTETTDEVEKKPPEPPKKYKRTINGKIVEMTKDEILKEWQDDFDKNPDTYLDLQSLKKTAYERLEEAARLRKEALDSKGKLKQNTIDALKEAGVDPYAFSEQLLVEKLKREQMPEAERKALEIEEENKRIKAELEQIKNEKENTTREYQLQQETERYVTKFTSAIEKAGFSVDQQLMYIASDIEASNYRNQEREIKAGIRDYVPLSDDQLATEINKRMDYLYKIADTAKKKREEEQRKKRVDDFKDKNDNSQVVMESNSPEKKRRPTMSEVQKLLREKYR